MLLGATHKALYSVMGISAVVKHVVALLGDRHTDVVFLSYLICCLGAEVALNGSHLLYSLGGICALADKYACTPVAAVHTGAGNDKVTRPKGLQRSLACRPEPFPDGLSLTYLLS